MRELMTWIGISIALAILVPLVIYIISRIQMAAWLSALHEFINQQQEKSNEKENK